MLSLTHLTIEETTIYDIVMRSDLARAFPDRAMAIVVACNDRKNDDVQFPVKVYDNARVL